MVSRCPRHPEAVLYTPSIRRAGKPDLSLPIGWCVECFKEGGPDMAIYLSRTLMALAFVDAERR